MSDMDVMACHSGSSDGDMRNAQHVRRRHGRAWKTPYDLLVPETGTTWTRPEYEAALEEQRRTFRPPATHRTVQVP